MGDEALTAGMVARRLGVAVTTLRTWHQRYGIGPSDHVPGHHRRYTAGDLARLEIMRNLTAQGVTPADAAAWARRVDPTEPAEDAARPPAPSRDGGGSVIPVGRAGPASRGLARAAMRLDAPTMRDILRATINTLGVIDAWDDVIMPVLVGVGERHATTRRLIEVEHVLSRCITETLATVIAALTGPGPRILLTCADEEQHTLPLEVLAAALAQAGATSRLLGARMPPEALADAVDRTGPAAVIIWSQMHSTADPAQLAHLLRRRHRPVLLGAAGRGWIRDSLPPGITPLTNLRDAVRLTLSAAGVPV